MVNLMCIPSSAHCSLHSGLIQPASWAISEADCKVCYAALRAAALEKSATTTLSVAFNLVCSLISGNSARTRNPILPITASKPVHPHEYFGMRRRRPRSKNLLALLSQRDTVFLDSTSCTLVHSACPLPSPGGRQNQYIPMIFWNEKKTAPPEKPLTPKRPLYI